MLITLTGIVLGTAVMFFAALKTIKLRELLLSGPNASKWKGLIYMMVFFLFGYLVSIVLVIKQEVPIFLVVTGIVFFVGAFFVLLVVVTAKSDIERIKETGDVLETKNKELEKINTELDLFAYRVSHDLRGPIASIRGLIEIARASKSKEETEFCLEKISVSTLKLDGFIQDILDLSRNSRTEIALEPVDVKSMVMEVMDSLRYMDHGQRIKFAFNAPEKLVIQTDSLRLKIIMTNLIANAYKYQDNQKEDPLIEVSCSEDDRSFNFSIKDNGIGIRDDHKEKIFEMFFRGTDKSVGTGLGLYVVKEIVEKLNGTINVNAALDHGSEFIVKIPNG